MARFTCAAHLSTYVYMWTKQFQETTAKSEVYIWSTYVESNKMTQQWSTEFLTNNCFQSFSVVYVCTMNTWMLSKNWAWYMVLQYTCVWNSVAHMFRDSSHFPPSFYCQQSVINCDTGFLSLTHKVMFIFNKFWIQLTGPYSNFVF